MLDAIDRVVIVGTGLLGGSLGLALRAHGYGGRIVGVGRRELTLARAVGLGCIDEGSTELEQAVRDHSLVVLATPLGTFQDLFEQINRCDLSRLMVTDVGSTKQQVCQQAKRLLSLPGRFVGSHPMAGSDQHGPEHAQADLFHSMPCIMTPEDESDSDVLDVVESLWTGLGMRLLKMGPLEHDKKVAAVSHLPHLLSVLLVQGARDVDGLDVASTGFRDVTRLARSDAKVWSDIFASNRGPVSEAIDRMIDRLQQVKGEIDRGQEDLLLGWLTEAKQVRDQWRGPQADVGQSGQGSKGNI